MWFCFGIASVCSLPGCAEYTCTASLWYQGSNVLLGRCCSCLPSARQAASHALPSPPSPTQPSPAAVQASNLPGGAARGARGSGRRGRRRRPAAAAHAAPGPPATRGAGQFGVGALLGKNSACFVVFGSRGKGTRLPSERLLAATRRALPGQPRDRLSTSCFPSPSLPPPPRCFATASTSSGSAAARGWRSCPARPARCACCATSRWATRPPWTTAARGGCRGAAGPPVFAAAGAQFAPLALACCWHSSISTLPSPARFLSSSPSPPPAPRLPPAQRALVGAGRAAASRGAPAARRCHGGPASGCSHRSLPAGLPHVCHLDSRRGGGRPLGGGAPAAGAPGGPAGAGGAGGSGQPCGGCRRGWTSANGC